MIESLKIHLLEKNLTHHQIKILLLTFVGLRDHEISLKMENAVKSVKSTKTIAFKKLGLKGKYEFYKYCLNLIIPNAIEEIK